MRVRYLNKTDLISQVTKRLYASDVVLDIGSGIQPQKLLRPRVHICAEPFGPYLDKLREKLKNETDRSYVFLKVSWADAVNFIPPKSVDTVFLLDVIEHLEKKVAKNLLKKTEEIAKTQLVIFTPLGFIKQSHPDGKDAWGLKGGKWQVHKSGFEPADFDKSWEILVSERFHYRDNTGKRYKKPHGAFFAIKTLSKLHRIRNTSQNLESEPIITNKKLRIAEHNNRKMRRELSKIQKSRGWKILSFIHRLRLIIPIFKDI